MTYNVFGGMLNLAQSSNHVASGCGWQQPTDTCTSICESAATWQFYIPSPFIKFKHV